MNNFRKLRPDLARKSEERNGEVPARLKDDIEVLRRWLKEQRHLMARIDDQYLVCFLRCSKFNHDEAKKRIDAFLTCRTVYYELFIDWCVNRQTLEIIKTGINLIPIDPAPYSGNRLFITRLGHYDPQRFTYLEVFKVLFMMMELTALDDDHTTVNGVEYILDLADCNVQCCGRLDSVILKKIYNYITECVPFRLIRAHIINMKKELQVYHNFARNILPAQLPFELIVHENMASLFRHVPQFALPGEYGGQNGTVHTLTMQLKLKMEAHTAYFARDVYYKSVEKNRPGPITDLQVDFSEERKHKKYKVF